jgi:secondary thiamine-phosphate synthase enzyme
VRQHQEVLEVRTRGRGFEDVTERVNEVLARAGIVRGVCVVFCRHTSCGLLVQENADPSVRRDLLAWWARIAPDGDPRYEHDDEGPDDMAAHLRTTLVRTSETLPFDGGRLALGRWQAVYLVEHRLAPHRRELVVHLTGE